jgi:hypothetical protein
MFAGAACIQCCVVMTFTMLGLLFQKPKVHAYVRLITMTSNTILRNSAQTLTGINFNYLFGFSFELNGFVSKH